MLFSDVIKQSAEGEYLKAITEVLIN